MEKSGKLLRPGGFFGMIVQSGWVSAPSMEELRWIFASSFKPVAFASMPYDVFGAYIDTIIVAAERLPAKKSLRDLASAPVSLAVFPPRFRISSLADFETFKKSADAVQWVKGDRTEFLVNLSEAETIIIRKVEAKGKLSEVSDIQRGVTPFDVTERKTHATSRPAFTRTVRRYKLSAGEAGFIRYDDSLAEYKPERYFKGPRLLLRELISRQFRLQATYTDRDFVTNKSMQSVLLTDTRYQIEYLLALLNSRLLSWYFLAVQSVGRRDDFPKIVLKQTRELPFRLLDWSSSKEKKCHDRLVGLVDEILPLQKKLLAAKTAHERQALERQIETTDRQIDQLVYELYGLTEEEIRIVQEEAASVDGCGSEGAKE